MEKFGKFQMFTPFLNEISSFSSVGEAVDGGHVGRIEHLHRADVHLAATAALGDERLNLLVGGLAADKGGNARGNAKLNELWEKV